MARGKKIVESTVRTSSAFKCPCGFEVVGKKSTAVLKLRLHQKVCCESNGYDFEPSNNKRLVQSANNPKNIVDQILILKNQNTENEN